MKSFGCSLWISLGFAVQDSEQASFVGVQFALFDSDSVSVERLPVVVDIDGT